MKVRAAAVVVIVFLTLMILPGCKGSKAAIGKGDTILVKDRVRIYHEESLFNQLVEVVDAGGDTTHFRPTPIPERSTYALAFPGTRFRVLARVPGGVKAIVESMKVDPSNDDHSSGRIAWILDEDLRDDAKPH